MKLLNSLLLCFLVQGFESYKYYYKRIGNGFDIILAQQPFGDYRELKPPKLQKNGFDKRGERPGVCYHGQFICSIPYQRSATQHFECTSDYQCPRFHKCCQPACFVHKVCQPAYAMDVTSTSVPSITTDGLKTSMSTALPDTSTNKQSTETDKIPTETKEPTTKQLPEPTTELPPAPTTSIQPESTTEVPPEPTTKVPFEPTTGKPPTSTTEIRSESTTKLPSKPTTEEPSETTTEGPSAITTKHPPEPTTELPTEPTTEVPPEPITEVSSEPTTKAPSDITTKVPPEPTTKVPSTTATEVSATTTKEPTAPTTEVPHKPTTEVPSEPTTEVSSKPTTEVSSETSTVVPPEPTTKVPFKPTSAVSSEPTTEVSSASTTEEPPEPEPQRFVANILMNATRETINQMTHDILKSNVTEPANNTMDITTDLKEKIRPELVTKGPSNFDSHENNDTFTETGAGITNEFLTQKSAVTTELPAFTNVTASSRTREEKNNVIIANTTSEPRTNISSETSVEKIDETATKATIKEPGKLITNITKNPSTVTNEEKTFNPTSKLPVPSNITIKSTARVEKIPGISTETPSEQEVTNFTIGASTEKEITTEMHKPKHKPLERNVSTETTQGKRTTHQISGISKATTTGFTTEHFSEPEKSPKSSQMTTKFSDDSINKKVEHHSGSLETTITNINKSTQTEPLLNITMSTSAVTKERTETVYASQLPEEIKIDINSNTSSQPEPSVDITVHPSTETKIHSMTTIPDVYPSEKNDTVSIIPSTTSPEQKYFATSIIENEIDIDVNEATKTTEADYGTTKLTIIGSSSHVTDEIARKMTKPSPPQLHGIPQNMVSRSHPEVTKNLNYSKFSIAETQLSTESTTQLKTNLEISTKNVSITAGSSNDLTTESLNVTTEATTELTTNGSSSHVTDEVARKMTEPSPPQLHGLPQKTVSPSPPEATTNLNDINFSATETQLSTNSTTQSKTISKISTKHVSIMAGSLTDLTTESFNETTEATTELTTNGSNSNVTDEIAIKMKEPPPQLHGIPQNTVSRSHSEATTNLNDIHFLVTETELSTNTTKTISGVSTKNVSIMAGSSTDLTTESLNLTTESMTTIHPLPEQFESNTTSPPIETIKDQNDNKELSTPLLSTRDSDNVNDPYPSTEHMKDDTHLKTTVTEVGVPSNTSTTGPTRATQTSYTAADITEAFRKTTTSTTIPSLHETAEQISNVSVKESMGLEENNTKATEPIRITLEVTLPTTENLARNVVRISPEISSTDKSIELTDQTPSVGGKEYVNQPTRVQVDEREKTSETNNRSIVKENATKAEDQSTKVEVDEERKSTNQTIFPSDDEDLVGSGADGSGDDSSDDRGSGDDGSGDSLSDDSEINKG